MVKIEQRKSRFLRHPLALKASTSNAFFMTDAARGIDGQDVCRRLPKGTFVIFRDYDVPDREKMALELRDITRKNGQYLLIAGDSRLARKVDADGIHLPEHMLTDLRKGPHFPIVTAACHSRMAIKRATEIGVDYVLVSPIFGTKSHPGGKSLGIHHFARLVRGLKVKSVALGGINERTASRLRPLKGLVGIAAIEGLAA